MNDNGTLDARFERIGEHLDELAARATRAVAELRTQSQSILDDVSTWKQHLDVSRVDAELARMDARDEMQRARAALEQRKAKIAQRLDQARDDSVEALRSLRAAMERALEDLGASLGTAARDEP
jgi:cell division protein ZapA (FtsZ GTPase activity inhibitor)